MASQLPISCAGLDGDHRDVLCQAVRNILATDIALQTYAQIIDGLPTAEFHANQYSHSYYDANHPIEKHAEICPAAVKATEKLRAEFDPASLKFQPSLLDAFNAAKPSSRTFNMRLLELVAVSVHQIGVFLYEQQLYLHDPATTDGLSVEAVTAHREEDGLLGRFQAKPPQMTMLFLPSFRNWEAYPDGVADLAGYWAEDRILGGVVLFNRSMEWSEEEPEPNVYLDSWQIKVTLRISQLHDKQQDELLRFLTGTDTASTTCPLPVLTTEENHNSIAVRDAIPVYKVYRDSWERYEQPAHVNAGRHERDCIAAPGYKYLESDGPEESG